MGIEAVSGVVGRDTVGPGVLLATADSRRHVHQCPAFLFTAVECCFIDLKMNFFCRLARNAGFYRGSQLFLLLLHTP